MKLNANIRLSNYLSHFALILVLAFNSACASSAKHAENIISKDHYVDVDDGVKIYVHERYMTDTDKSNTVLLLHSAGIDLRMWDCQVDDMSTINYLVNQGLRVIAVDYRGFGKSTKLMNGNTITIAQAADDVAKVIKYFQKTTGLKKVKIYGTSVGAIVSARLASEYPELVDRIAMTGGFYFDMKDDAKRMFPEQFFLNKKDGYINYDPELMAEFMPSAKKEVVDWYQKTYPKEEKFPGGLFVNFWHLPAVDKPENILAPVLLVNGAKDIYATRDDSMKFLSSIGSKDITYVEQGGIGHAPMIEKGYQDFRKILISFLNG